LVAILFWSSLYSAVFLGRKLTPSGIRRSAPTLNPDL